MLTIVRRNSRLNCMLKQGLRRYEPRSRFPNKSPFRAYFRAFYAHPANKSALRAEGASHFWASGKRGWPATSPWPLFCRPTLHASPTPHQRDQVVRRPSPAGYLPDTDNRFVKDRTGPDRDERSHYSSMAPNRAIPTEKTLRVSWLTAVGPFSHGRRRSTPVAPSVPANGHKP